jgi:hypothetical protein
MGAETIAAIAGAVSGVGSFFWHIYNTCRDRSKQPHLKIELDENWKSVRVKYYNPSREIIRRFSCLYVKNEKITTAKRCVAKLKVLDSPSEARQLDIEHTLHWADVPYNYKTTEPDPVDIGSERRRFDVAFALITESTRVRSRTQAGTTTQSPSEQPNISGSFPPQNYTQLGTHQSPSEQPNISGASPSGIYNPEMRPQFQDTSLASSEGAFIAVQIALSNPSEATQCYLPPGNYEVEISVNCENGKGDKKKFKITSSEDPDRLDINEV